MNKRQPPVDGYRATWSCRPCKPMFRRTLNIDHTPTPRWMLAGSLRAHYDRALFPNPEQVLENRLPDVQLDPPGILPGAVAIPPEDPSASMLQHLRYLPAGSLYRGILHRALRWDRRWPSR